MKIYIFVLIIDVGEILKAFSNSTTTYYKFLAMLLNLVDGMGLINARSAISRPKLLSVWLVRISSSPFPCPEFQTVLSEERKFELDSVRQIRFYCA